MAYLAKILKNQNDSQKPRSSGKIPRRGNTASNQHWLSCSATDDWSRRQ